MVWIGCADWAEFRALSGTGMAEPPGMIAAVAEADGSGDASFQAVWREGVETAFLSQWRKDREPCIRSLGDEEAFAMLLRMVGTARRSGDARDNRFAEALLGEAEAVGARIGAKIAWHVECMSGERWVGPGWTVAVYEDLALAMAHSAAAAMAEHDDDEGGEDGPSIWSVTPEPFRTALPASLEEFASGRRVPASRPTMDRGDGSCREAVTVSVPGRGEMAFSGAGAREAASAFLCGLERAKPSSEEQCMARDCDAEGVASEGAALRWSRPASEWREGGEGRAEASGPDASGMAAEAAGLVAAASLAAKENQAWTAAWDADVLGDDPG